MLGMNSRVRVFAYRSPVDMRKSFNTLSWLVTGLGHDVMHGDVFVFVGKSRRRAKVLWFDKTGLCLLCKRLEKGRFAAVWERAEMTTSELTLFIEGSEAVGKLKLSPDAFDLEKDGKVHFSRRQHGSTWKERR